MKVPVWVVLRHGYFISERFGRPPSVIYPRNYRGRHSGRFLSRYFVLTYTVSRGNKTAIELFLAGLVVGTPVMRRRMDDGKSKQD